MELVEPGRPVVEGGGPASVGSGKWHGYCWTGCCQLRLHSILGEVDCVWAVEVLVLAAVAIG